MTKQCRADSDARDHTLQVIASPPTQVPAEFVFVLLQAHCIPGAPCDKVSEASDG